MRRSLATLALVPLVLAGGCADAPPAAPSATPRVPSHQAVLAALSTLSADTTDSWFSADVDFSPSLSVGLPEPGYNPATGGVGLSAESPPTTLQIHVEGGYLATGETLLQGILLADGISDPQPSDPVAFRFVNDVPTLFDRSGSPVALDVDDYALAQEILDDVGSLRDVVFDLTGGPADSGGSGGTFFSRGDDDSLASATTSVERDASRRLKAINHTVSRRKGATRVVSGFRTTIRNLRGHSNGARDAVRQRRRTVTDAQRVSTPKSTEDCSPMFGRLELSSCFGGGTIGGPSNPDNCNVLRTYVADTVSSANIVFQHGFLSDACTWEVSRPYLHQSLALGMAVEARTGHTEAYAVQQAQLRSGLDAARGSRAQFVLVGHSQGGVISRLAAQQMPTDLVRGVVTLNSPNQGALIAEPYRSGPALGLVQAIPYGLTPPTVVRWLNRVIPSPVRGVVGMASQALVVAPLVSAVRCAPDRAAACDARPGSGILQQVNSASSAFPTVAIVGNSRHDLVFWRLVGDAASSRTLGGRRTVHRFWRYRLWGLGLGAILHFVPGGTMYAQYLWQVTTVIIASDLAWRGLYAGGSGGDGFIHAAGQPVYGPNTERIFVQDADAHTAAQFAMDRGIDAMERALRTHMRVPERQ